MNRATSIVSVAAVAALAGALAAAQPAKDAGSAPQAQPNAQPEFQLPPGMTMEDMMACVEAGTPGAMHEHLAWAVGTWDGKSKMWMGPGMDAMESTCVTVITSIMDGRYNRMELTGDFPGMGPFHGQGTYGFDNVSGKFQCTWIDNCSTGIMVGSGELSDDGKTTNWRFTYNCPVTKKPAVIREVERRTGKDTMVVTMYATQPRTDVEYKMMEIHYTRRGATTSAR